MNREDIMNAIRTLAQSQGMYSRLLSELQALSEESFDAVMTDLENQHFGSVVDMVMWIEN